MSSKPIYPHVPYFYIIEHISTGKRYVGCRYAKGCHPSEFMTEDGYQTSSRVVHQIIKDEGLDAFKVISIKTQDEVGDVYEYETKFLVENNCANSDVWLNLHNNEILPFGSTEFSELMMKKHGVDHNSKMVDHAEKCKISWLSSLGVDNPMRSGAIKAKVRNIIFEKYGVDHQSKSEDVKAKMRNTNIERRGVAYASQSIEFRENCRNTSLMKYGVDHHTKTKEFRDEFGKISIKRFEDKITKLILSGDFGKFEYIYDTVDDVYLWGVLKSMNRNSIGRYIKIGVSPKRKNSKRYVDILTGNSYYIDISMFKSNIPDTLVIGKSYKC